MKLCEDCSELMNNNLKTHLAHSKCSRIVVLRVCLELPEEEKIGRFGPFPYPLVPVDFSAAYLLYAKWGEVNRDWRT